MHKYMELLKTAEKIIKQLSSETQTMVHNMSQARNDYESLLGQVAKKRQELEALEVEHKNSIDSYINGVKRINDDSNAANAEAHAFKIRAEQQLNEAMKTRTQVEAIKKELERERREYASVGSSRKVAA